MALVEDNENHEEEPVKVSVSTRHYTSFVFYVRLEGPQLRMKFILPNFKAFQQS